MKEFPQSVYFRPYISIIMSKYYYLFHVLQSKIHNTVDSCNDPAPLDGYTSMSTTFNGHYPVGSNVSFSCEHGFQLSGNSYSICQENHRLWSPEPPSFCHPNNEINVLKFWKKKGLKKLTIKALIYDIHVHCFICFTIEYFNFSAKDFIIIWMD